MTVALLFPGQGSQHAGMLHDLPTTPAAAQAWTTAADTLRGLGLPVDDLDSADALVSTTYAQLALLIAGVVNAQSLVVDHGLAVAAVAGHSVGAFSAAVTAGVLEFAVAIQVVQLRGKSMITACAGRDWGMASLEGLPLNAVEQLVNRLSTPAEPLWVATINSARQVVVSGTSAALAVLHREAPAAGLTSMVFLAVPVASHCPIQASTARSVEAALRHAVPAHAERQRYSYFANCTGRRIRADPQAVLQDLARSVQCPVRWHDIVRILPEVGVTATVQVPPGHSLTALASGASPDLVHVAVDDIGGAAAVHRAAGPLH